MVHFLCTIIFFGLSNFKTSACGMFVYSEVYLPTLQAPNLDLCNVIRTLNFIFKIMKCE